MPGGIDRMMSDPQEHSDNRSRLGSQTLDILRKSSIQSDEGQVRKVSHSPTQVNEIKSPQNSSEDKENDFTINSQDDDKIKSSMNSNNDNDIKSSQSSHANTDIESEISNEDDEIKSFLSSISEDSKPTSREKTLREPQKEPQREPQKVESPEISITQNEETSSKNSTREKTPTSHERPITRPTTTATPLPTSAGDSPIQRRSKVKDQKHDWQIMQIGFDFHNWPVAIFRGSGTWRLPDRVDQRRQVARLSGHKRPFSPDHRFDSWVNIFDRDTQFGRTLKSRQFCKTPKGNNWKEKPFETKSEKENTQGQKEGRPNSSDNSDTSQQRRSRGNNSQAGRLLRRPQTTPPNVSRRGHDVNRLDSDRSRSPKRQTSLKPSEETGDQGRNLPAIAKDRVCKGGQKNIPGLKRSHSVFRTPHREDMDTMVKSHTRLTAAFRAKISPNQN